MDQVLYSTGYIVTSAVWFVGKTVVVAGATVASGVIDAAVASATTPSKPASVPAAVVKVVTEPLISKEILNQSASFGWPVMLLVGAGIAFYAIIPCIKRLAWEEHQINEARRVQIQAAIAVERQAAMAARERKAKAKRSTVQELNLNNIATTIADHLLEECVVCRENKKTIAYSKCKHLALCSECAKKMTARKKKCPNCREYSDSFIHVIT